MAAMAADDALECKRGTTDHLTQADAMDVNVDVGAAGSSMDRATAAAAAKPRKRVAFVGAEYIEYDLDSAPVVRRCGVHGEKALDQRTDDDVELEFQARVFSCEDDAKRQRMVAVEGRRRGLKLIDFDGLDAATMRARLESEYEQEMREVIEARGFPCLDAADVPVRVQFHASELLVAWSIVAPNAGAEDAEERIVAELDGNISLDSQRKHMELCRKQVFGPVVDGYAFGRRFFSIDSFLSLLELEELVALAEAHGIDVPEVPKAILAKIKVTDRELISTYSPTGLGKPLKMLTFRELVEEAYARGILMEDERDAKNKKSKRAWVDALRPVLQAEMRAFKIREVHADLIHAFLIGALETKMQSMRTDSIAALVRSYLETHPDPLDSATDGAAEMAALHRYFRALLQWHQQQPSVSPVSAPQPSGISSPPPQPRVVVEPMSPIV